MAARTLENCVLIKACVKLGIGEPTRYWNLDKCLGYQRGKNDDEPCEKCKNCKYYISLKQEG